MQIRYYLVLILLILNLIPLIRFRNSKYFYFFFLISLLDPVSFIITDILHSNIPIRYYIFFISMFYFIAFPLFEKKIMAILFVLMIFSFLTIQKYSIVPMITSTTVFLSMIIYIISDLHGQLNKEGSIEIFNLLLILSLSLNITRVFLVYEYRTYFTEYYNVITTIDIVLTLLIGIAGPTARFYFSKSFEQTNKLISGYDLTRRELQVLKLLSKGLTSQEIAEKLYLSKKTIDYYRSNIKSKLSITKKSELVNFYTTTVEEIKVLKNDNFWTLRIKYQ